MTMFPMTESESERDDSDDSEWDDSDLSTVTSSRYDDENKRPTRAEAEAVVAELQKIGLDDPAYLAKGGYGHVYRLHYRTRARPDRPRVVAVKVLYSRQSRDLPKRVEVFHKAFDRALRRRFAQHRRLREDLDVDTGYFTEDLVLPRVPVTDAHGRTKEYTLHLMELLPGVELYDYVRKEGHRLTLRHLMSIFCRLLHALNFFHGAGLLFNDLKLENLMVDPVTHHISFIDFYDSNTQCNHSRCAERPRPHIIYTFRDPFHEEGLHEDIWRLGITLLDILESIHRSHAYVHGRLHKEELRDRLPGDHIKDECKYSERYPTAYVKNLVRRVCHKAAVVYAHDRSYGAPARTLFAQVRGSLLQMMHERPDARPSVTRLLRTAPWKVCAASQPAPKLQRPSYLPVQRLTPVQRSRKANVVDLSTAKLVVAAPAASATTTTDTAMASASTTSSSLGDDWQSHAVSSSTFRSSTPSPHRRRAAHPTTATHKRRHRPTAATRKRPRTALSLSSASATTLAARMPKTRDALRRRMRALDRSDRS